MTDTAPQRHDVRITALRKADYRDLQALYENPIQHACDVHEGQTWTSHGGQRPEGMCESAWESMRWFVEELAAGRGHFFADRDPVSGDFTGGWMRNPYSALISCNDGFRPVSFLLEKI